MSDYTTIPSTGKLKLKGVKDASITKKKKKKSNPSDPSASAPTNTSDTFQDNSVVLAFPENEDSQITKTDQLVTGKEVGPATSINNDEDPDLSSKLKTEAEKRHEEQRRKRLEDRLKKEGIKTHKQRVEELNKYLSRLSEHHDMPKIGPG